jgi:hypothetical protein
MAIVWGLVVTALSSLCWGGQLVSFLAPEVAARWGLTEAEAEVDPAFWADARGESLWDVVTLWTMVVAGVLLVVDHDAWAYFGLVGGGTYVYFAGRGIIVRLAMRSRGLRIGNARSVQVGIVALAVWGVMGAVTIAAATMALAGK